MSSAPVSHHLCAVSWPEEDFHHGVSYAKVWESITGEAVSSTGGLAGRKFQFLEE